MARKIVLTLGMLLGVSALVIDGNASTAEACWGCRTSCCRTTCRTRCCEPVCSTPCYSSCYRPCYRPCYSSCNSCSSCYAPVYAAPVYTTPVYAAPACSTCTTRYAAPGTYVTPINVSQVPGYGARYGYSAPVIAAPVTSFRVNSVSFR
ncbi:MAG: hypothetical protein JSS02_09150 [Planctomycetes bacterium]|nr:hypothetical protein [Planctomycetota bacterium]